MQSQHPGPVQAMLVDFDGTIADSFEYTSGVAVRVARQCGTRTVDADEIRRVRALSFAEFIVHKHVPLRRVPILLARMRKALRAGIADVAPVKGMTEAIGELSERGIRLGIVTSNAPENVRRFLAGHDLEFFDGGIFVSGIRSKARALRRARRSLHLAPRGVLFVGDTTTDIVFSHRAGIKPAAVTRGYNTEQALRGVCPDHVPTEPRQLLDLARTVHPRCRREPTNPKSRA